MPTTINPSDQTITQYNIQTGGAGNLLNNVAPSATSGVAVISQGAAAQPVFGTVVVAGGGTGQITLTNHGVLVGAGTSAITQLAAGSTGQVLQSGGASGDPAYSTATYPSTATGTGKVLIADGTNWVASTPTFPNASATSGKIIISDGTNWIASTPTYPNTSGTAGKVVISDGTNNVYSTPTFPNASATSGKIIVSDGTNWIASTPTFPNASATSGKFIRSDGTNWIASTPTLPTTAGTSGNFLYSDGTNFVSAIPTVASLHTTSNTPTGTSSTAAYKMMGLGGAWTLTPKTYAVVRITVDGQAINNTNGDGIAIRMAYGTGTAPNNGDAATGTQIGNTTLWTALTGLVSQGVPFAKQGIIFSLSPGTAYWFDLQLEAITGGTASVTDLTMTAQELPS